MKHAIAWAVMPSHVAMRYRRAGTVSAALMLSAP